MPGLAPSTSLASPSPAHQLTAPAGAALHTLVTRKLLRLVPVPCGEVTTTGPVVAPAGTVVVMLPSLTTLNVAEVPLNLTAVAPVKPDPLAPKFPSGGAGCSIESKSLCEEATPRIIANALGPSPLEENLRYLTDEIGGRMTGSPAMTRDLALILAARLLRALARHCLKRI